MRELHLFAGIGGGILGGMLLGHRCAGAVEVNPYCRKVLEARQLEGVLESFPILEDVRTFDGKPWRGKVDVVCGGFPCTPWSTAGKRLGTADPRHLWPEMALIVSEVRPAYVFAENVSLASFEQPWRDLRGMGYRVPRAIQISSGDLGAPYRRNRWWLLAADADLVGEPVRPSYAEVAMAPEPCDADIKGPAWRITSPGLRPNTPKAVPYLRVNLYGDKKQKIATMLIDPHITISDKKQFVKFEGIKRNPPSGIVSANIVFEGAPREIPKTEMALKPTHDNTNNLLRAPAKADGHANEAENHAINTADDKENHANQVHENANIDTHAEQAAEHH